MSTLGLDLCVRLCFGIIYCIVWLGKYTSWYDTFLGGGGDSVSVRIYLLFVLVDTFLFGKRRRVGVDY